MANYRKVRKLSPAQAAYIAGLVDGEGTISLARKHRYENRSVVLTICNTGKRILFYVLEILGTGHLTNKKAYLPHHTPSATYVIRNRQALELLRQILPFLQSYKADRAALLLRHYVQLTPRNGRYSERQREERQRFIDKFFSISAHPD